MTFWLSVRALIRPFGMRRAQNYCSPQPSRHHILQTAECESLARVWPDYDFATLPSRRALFRS